MFGVVLGYVENLVLQSYRWASNFGWLFSRSFLYEFKSLFQNASDDVARSHAFGPFKAIWASINSLSERFLVLFLRAFVMCGPETLLFEKHVALRSCGSVCMFAWVCFWGAGAIFIRLQIAKFLEVEAWENNCGLHRSACCHPEEAQMHLLPEACFILLPVMWASLSHYRQQTPHTFENGNKGTRCRLCFNSLSSGYGRSLLTQRNWHICEHLYVIGGLAAFVVSVGNIFGLRLMNWNLAFLEKWPFALQAMLEWAVLNQVWPGDVPSQQSVVDAVPMAAWQPLTAEPNPDMLYLGQYNLQTKWGWRHLFVCHSKYYCLVLREIDSETTLLLLASFELRRKSLKIGFSSSLGGNLRGNTYVRRSTKRILVQDLLRYAGRIDRSKNLLESERQRYGVILSHSSKLLSQRTTVWRQEVAPSMAHSRQDWCCTN